MTSHQFSCDSVARENMLQVPFLWCNCNCVESCRKLTLIHCLTLSKRKDTRAAIRVDAED